MIYGLFLRIFLKFFSIECGASREIFWWFVPPKWTKELCSRLPGGNYSMVPSACRISLLFHWLERLLDKGETRSSVLHWKLRAEMDWIYNSGTWNCRASCGGLDLFICMFALILSPPSQSRTSLRQSGASGPHMRCPSTLGHSKTVTMRMLCTSPFPLHVTTLFLAKFSFILSRGPCQGCNSAIVRLSVVSGCVQRIAILFS